MPLNTYYLTTLTVFLANSDLFHPQFGAHYLDDGTGNIIVSCHFPNGHSNIETWEATAGVTILPHPVFQGNAGVGDDNAAAINGILQAQAAAGSVATVTNTVLTSNVATVTATSSGTDPIYSGPGRGFATGLVSITNSSNGSGVFNVSGVLITHVVRTGSAGAWHYSIEFPLIASDVTTASDTGLLTLALPTATSGTAFISATGLVGNIATIFADSGVYPAVGVCNNMNISGTTQGSGIFNLNTQVDILTSSPVQFTFALDPALVAALAPMGVTLGTDTGSYSFSGGSPVGGGVGISPDHSIIDVVAAVSAIHGLMKLRNF